MEQKQTLVFQAPIATRSGYGDHSRDLLKSLRDLNKFDIKIISTRWGACPMDALSYDNEFHKWMIDNIVGQLQTKPDVYIQVTVPNEFQPLGHYNIGITAGIETTVCNVDWITGCDRMDLIIVPSEHSRATIQDVVYTQQDNVTKQVIQTLKTKKPFEVLFEGYNEESYSPTNIVPIKELDEIPEQFCFLSVGHWLRGDMGEDRKNISMLIKAFSVIFKNEQVKPALVLKTSSAGFSVLDREDILMKIKQILGADAGKVSVYLLHGYLTDAEMNSLYRHSKVKSFITFTKGEGFGRPILEFSLTGKPVIAPGWSGHLDFLKNGAVLLEGSLQNVHPSAADQFLLKEAQWFNVNLSKSIPVIKDVFKNYDKYLTASKALGEHNSKLFTLSKMTEKMGQIFEKHGVYGKVLPKLQPLQLPKLKTVQDSNQNVDLPPLNKLPKLEKVVNE